MAIQLVHADSLLLLGLREGIPSCCPHLGFLLIGGDLGQDLLGELRRAARVALDRAAAG